MKILAVDSSAVSASVAVCEDERRLSEVLVNTTNTHSETLLPMVETALSNARLTLDDIDMLACTTGPGSFTGIRIGVSLVKGLAFARSLPCVGVSTLEATAESLSAVKCIAVAVGDARRCGLYNASFRCGDGKLERLTPDKLDLPDELALEIETRAKNEKMNICFVGEEYERVEGLVKSTRVKHVPALLRLPSAYSAAQCARRIYESASDKSVFGDEVLAAVYLRPAQAERERLERLAAKQTT